MFGRYGVILRSLPSLIFWTICSYILILSFKNGNVLNWFVLICALLFTLAGWIIVIWSIVDVARQPKKQ